MLGMGQGDAASVAQDTGIIFDVGLDDFEDAVMKASLEVPVIVDFWAPWCGPCKQLMPVLEKIVQAAGGAVRLAKVNLDENQQLGAMLRVQSVPTVYGFFGGQPVDAFQGVQAESEIQAFVDKLVAMAQQNQPGAINVDEVLQAGAEALTGGNLGLAQQCFAQILQQDPKHVGAFVGMVRVYLAAGQVDQAQNLVDNVPPEIAADRKFAQARTALEMATQDGGDVTALMQKVADAPDDLQARLELSSALFATGQREDALEQALEIVRCDREWGDDAGRKQVLKFFEAAGMSDPFTIEGRKKLSSVLFS